MYCWKAEWWHSLWYFAQQFHAALLRILLERAQLAEEKKLNQFMSANFGGEPLSCAIERAGRRG